MMITGLVLVTLGAILRYAIDSDWDALDVPIVGLILMCVGALAFIVGVMQTFLLRDRDGRRTAAPQAPPPPAAGHPYPPQSYQPQPYPPQQYPPQSAPPTQPTPPATPPATPPGTPPNP